MITLLFCSISSSLVAIFVGTLLTQNKYLTLVQLSKKLDRKPFNCKPCLTFHISWILHSLISVLLSSWTMWLVGLLSSFMIFIILYLENKSKITK